MTARPAALAALAAGAVALGVVAVAQAPPASADLLPVPLPTLPPVQVGPVSASPVTGTVNGVVGAAAAAPVAPVGVTANPSHSGQPASAGDGGAGAGPDGAAASPSPPPAYSPPPEEQAALPPEPERLALAGQQARFRDSAPGLDQLDGASALAAGGGDGRFIWPLTFRGRPPITQRFGCTGVPGEPYSAGCATHRFHGGIDLGVRADTPVYAAASGVAHVFRSDGGYGNHVLVAHGNGWFTLYAHLREPVVRDGEVVRRGEPIGLSGSTGFSTGPHLHFEVRSGQQAVDPCAFLGC